MEILIPSLKQGRKAHSVGSNALRLTALRMRVIRDRYASHAAMTAASLEYIEVFYNRTRQHSTLGCRSPSQYPEEWIKRQNQENFAA